MVFTNDLWSFIVLSIAGYFFFVFTQYLRRLERLSPNNKAVLITGCDSGFGHELALRLPPLGYHVFAGCHSIDREGAKSLRSIPGVDVVELDVTSEKSISAAVKATSQKLGEKVLWAVVNNAGIALMGEVEWYPMETLLNVFDVNTFGFVRVTKKFLPFIKLSKGRIVNVTSITANRRVIGGVGYSMSKAAARVFSTGIRLELRKWDVKVVEVAPYFYSTPLVKKDRIMDSLRQSWDQSESEIISSLGCDRGFGYLLAQRMARLGYRVLAGCLLVEEKGAQELELFPNIRVFHLDVTDDQSVKNAAKIVSEELTETELWAIVNNAGIIHFGEMEWTRLRTILDVCDVNTFGMVRVTQQLLPFLKKSRGRIVNVTSMIAEKLVPGCIGYAMSKAAAKSFNDVIRMELKKWGIKVINVAPFSYSTQIADRGRMMHLLKDSWTSSDPETRTGLGEEYFKKYLNTIVQFARIIDNPRVNEVVDCMEDAITSASPKIYYRPGSIFIKLVFEMAFYLPTILQDCIKVLFFPKRRET